MLLWLLLRNDRVWMSNMGWLFSIISSQTSRISAVPSRILLLFCGKIWGRLGWNFRLNLHFCPLFRSFFFIHIFDKIEYVVCGSNRIYWGNLFVFRAFRQLKRTAAILCIFLVLLLIGILVYLLFCWLIFVHELLGLFENVLRVENSVRKFLPKRFVGEHSAHAIS